MLLLASCSFRSSVYYNVGIFICVPNDIVHIQKKYWTNTVSSLNEVWFGCDVDSKSLTVAIFL